MDEKTLMVLEEFRRYETLTRHVKERSVAKYIIYLKMFFFEDWEFIPKKIRKAKFFELIDL